MIKYLYYSIYVIHFHRSEVIDKSQKGQTIRQLSEQISRSIIKLRDKQIDKQTKKFIRQANEQT